MVVVVAVVAVVVVVVVVVAAAAAAHHFHLKKTCVCVCGKVESCLHENCTLTLSPKLRGVKQRPVHAQTVKFGPGVDLDILRQGFRPAPQPRASRDARVVAVSGLVQAAVDYGVAGVVGFQYPVVSES